MSLMQLSLYPVSADVSPTVKHYPICVTPEILELLAADAVVAIGVSGGKDSSAVAVRTVKLLNELGHRGPIVLIHSDLGRIEWRDSFSICRRLAETLGLELIVVRRRSGDMLDRWRQRWNDNVDRYASLSFVQLILPWSTPSMRFCTSELKQQVICRELVKRFPGRAILSVSGIRREESTRRAQSPVFRPQELLCRTSSDNIGYDWHPILDWTLAQVLGFLHSEGIPLHEAYTRYNSSRVSCCFCILASKHDLIASSTCAEHRPMYCALVALEAVSTFAFQERQWLADVAPHLLPTELKEEIARAKAAAEERMRAEAQIPKHLLYTKGWPTCIPSAEEARLLAHIRMRVAAAVKLRIEYTQPEAIIKRYEDLIEAKLLKDEASRCAISGKGRSAGLRFRKNPSE